MDKEETITIPLVDFERLTDNERFLNCLLAAGVDNWEGYEDAIEILHEET